MIIRILHILGSAHFGGIERLVLDLANVQAEDCKLSTDVLFLQKGGEFLDNFLEAGLQCHFAHLRSGYDLSICKYFRIFRIFRQYDILHIHSFNIFVSGCAVMSGKKIFYTEHGLFGFGRKKTWTDPIKAFFLKRFLNNHVDYITFNSKFTKRIAENRYRLDNVESSIVYNGIAFEKELAFPPEIEGILNQIRGKFVVGTTSRFAGVKRIDRLIEAFKKFHRNNKDTILLLVGDGPLRDDLQRLIKHLGLSEQTIFTGFRENVREFQNLMDVCVFPSENESFGLVAVETLSLGKPTIVFKDGGGIVEVVGGFSQHDVVEDIPDLVEMLQYYYNNRNEISSLLPDRIRYAQQFDVRNVRSEFQTIYERLLN